MHPKTNIQEIFQEFSCSLIYFFILNKVYLFILREMGEKEGGKGRGGGWGESQACFMLSVQSWTRGSICEIKTEPKSRVGHSTY